jgi:hypothetical protein
MKKLVLFVGLATLLFGDVPPWYHALHVKPNNYLGYGDGATENEAKQNALTDISSQIYTKVESQRVQKEKLINGNYEQNIEVQSSQNTKADMSDYELLKAENVDGRYYVGIAYEDISDLDRFIKKVEALGFKRVLNENNTTIAPNNNLLQKSAYAEQLRKTFGRDIDFKIERKNKNWFLRYKSALQHITNSEFALFFLSSENEKLQINTNKKNNILYDGDEFSFGVKSKESGFVNIVSVYEDGTVATLIKNAPIQKNKLTTLPDEKYGATPVAGLLEKKKETYDMYVLIYSPKKMMLDQFGDASDEHIEDERHKNFGELVEFLNDKNYTTLRVVTRAR